jgi:hypothetical protein
MVREAGGVESCGVAHPGGTNQTHDLTLRVHQSVQAAGQSCQTECLVLVRHGSQHVTLYVGRGSACIHARLLGSVPLDWANNDART